MKPRNPFFSGFFAIAQIAIHFDGHTLISFEVQLIALFCFAQLGKLQSSHREVRDPNPGLWFLLQLSYFKGALSRYYSIVVMQLSHHCHAIVAPLSHYYSITVTLL